MTYAFHIAVRLPTTRPARLRPHVPAVDHQSQSSAARVHAYRVLQSRAIRSKQDVATATDVSANSTNRRCCLGPAFLMLISFQDHSPL